MSTVEIVDQPAEQAEQAPVVQPVQQPAQKQKKERKPFLWGITNKPYVLGAIPLVFGAMWLANNMWVITDNLDKPYALLAVPVAVLSVIVGWATIKFFQTIAAWCKSAGQAFQRARKEDGSAQFFWLVIIVFMIVSVFTSGSFFTLLEHDVLPGLGYATALFIDLVAVQSMRARLNAVRMRDMKGANLYLFGVLICSGASAFANVYISLAHFDATATGVLPQWMLTVAPWFGLVFPALILLLSITADYTLDQISTKLDPENYKIQEEKRMKLLEIQRDMLKRRAMIEQEMDMLNGRKERRVFFLINWLFPVRQQPQAMIDLDGVRNDMMAFLQTQMQAFTGEAQNAYANLESSLVRQISSIDRQRDTDLSIVSQQISKAQTALFHQLEQAKEQILLEALNQVEYVQDTDPLQPIYQEEEIFDYTPITPVVKEPEKTEKVEDIPDTNPTDTTEIDEDTKKVFIDYPFLAAEHSAGVRSLSIEEIMKHTGHTPQMVRRREKEKVFKKTRRDGFYSIASVITWLKTEKLPAKKETTILAESMTDKEPENSQNTEEVFEQKGARITAKLSEDMLQNTPAEYALV